MNHEPKDYYIIHRNQRPLKNVLNHLIIFLLGFLVGFSIGDLIVEIFL